MSTEVESSQVDAGLTAEAAGQGEPEAGEAGLGGGGSGGRPAGQQGPEDGHRELKENDKENEGSGGGGGGGADSAVEAVKRKVVEAPPPKVNPWTRRTSGRVPAGSSPQERGEPPG